MSDKLKIMQEDIDLFNYDEYWNFIPYTQKEILTELHEDYDAPRSSLEGH